MCLQEHFSVRSTCGAEFKIPLVLYMQYTVTIAGCWWCCYCSAVHQWHWSWRKLTATEKWNGAKAPLIMSTWTRKNPNVCFFHQWKVD